MSNSSGKPFDVLCFGSITLDMFLRPKQPLCRNIDGQDSFCFPVGGKFSLKHAHEMSGGGAANTSVGFAKLGLLSSCIGIVGQDDKRDYLINQIEKVGVNTANLVVAKNQQTSLSLIFVTADGRRTAFTHRAMTPDFNEQTLLKAPDAKSIYVSHINEEAEGILHALPDWKAENPKRIMAWNPGKTQFKKGLKHYEKMLPSVDMLILNREEAEMFTQKKATTQAVSQFLGKVVTPATFAVDEIINGQALAQDFLDRGVRKVIITDGKRGAQFIDQNGNYAWVPSAEQHPKNTLGAGDAFSVGAVWALLFGLDYVGILKAGSLNAWSTIQAFGAQRGQLSARQMATFLEKGI